MNEVVTIPFSSVFNNDPFHSNRVFNVLSVVSGFPARFEEFLETLKRADESCKCFIPQNFLGSLLPIPKELNEGRIGEQRSGLALKREQVLYSGCDYGFTWAYINWGTRSEALMVTLSPVSGVSVGFVTLYSSPLPWLVSISQFFPEITFRLTHLSLHSTSLGFTNVCDGKIVEEGRFAFQEGSLKNSSTVTGGGSLVVEENSQIFNGTENLVFTFEREGWTFLHNEGLLSESFLFYHTLHPTFMPEGTKKFNLGKKVWLDQGLIAKAHISEGFYHHISEPAVVSTNGSQFWFKEGLPHRGGSEPAIEWNDGSKEWWVEGKRHRTDGPAVEGCSGMMEWWVDGIKSSFPDLCQSAVELTVPESLYALCGSSDLVVRTLASNNPHCPKEGKVLTFFIDK